MILEVLSRYNMSHTSLGIVAAILVAAAAIGFLTTQSVAAQTTTNTDSFNTGNTAEQTSTQDGTATGGNGGNGGLSILGGSANGGAGGNAYVSQFSSQQAAQSGAFGSSSNSFG